MSAQADPAGAEERREPRPEPLRGRRILLTRAESDGDRLRALLEAGGAEVESVALTRIAPPADPAPMRSAARALARYDWIACTSSRAVAALAEAIEQPSKDGTLTHFRGRWACVGPATAGEVRRRFGREPDLVPERFDARSLATAMVRWERQAPLAETPADDRGGGGRGGGGGERGRGPGRVPRVLFPCAENARGELPEALRRAGMEVDVVIAYRTLPAPPPIERLVPPPGGSDVRRGARGGAGSGAGGGSWDAVVFTSGTAVSVLLETCRGAMGRTAAREWLSAASPAVLGASAEEALRAEGIEPAVRAPRPTPEDLVSALVQYLGR